MKIIVDAMGGDNAPVEVLKGSIEASKKMNLEIVLVGDSVLIKKELAKFNTEGANLYITHAPDVITCDDDPTTSIRNKKESSMVVGMKMLAAGEGDAFVSAGSTGALISGATLLVKRIRGIRRVALAPIIPTANGAMVLVDGGANADCGVDFLEQFVLMGDAYAKAVLRKPEPRVGLLNNGSEESKGSELYRTAHQALKELPVNFIGNVEAREVLFGGCDVLVADGFAGNVLLKSIEGTAKYFAKNLKTALKKNPVRLIGALLIKGGIKELSQKFDYDEHGGAPVLGASKPVIKAHGSSNAKAFYNAIRQAKQMVSGQMIESIKSGLASKQEEAQ